MVEELTLLWIDADPLRGEFVLTTVDATVVVVGGEASIDTAFDGPAADQLRRDAAALCAWWRDPAGDARALAQLGYQFAPREDPD